MDRAAFLLWRLRRLARYEVETVAGAMEDAEGSARPPPAGVVPPFPKHLSPTREDQLRDLREARHEPIEVAPAGAVFAVQRGTESVLFAVAESIREAAGE